MSLDIDEAFDWERKMKALNRMLRYSNSGRAGGQPTPAFEGIQAEDLEYIQTEGGEVITTG